jgi:hypothetical protein
MDTRIVKYFRLCAVSAPRVHPVANLEIANQIVSEYESEQYFMNSKGALVPKETIIGGWNIDGKVEGRSRVIIY